MTGFFSTIAIIWRLAIPYFRDSNDRVAGRMLLAAVVAMELGAVGLNVLINQWNARFYNALQDRTWDAFMREMWVFSALAGAYIVLRAYQLYLNQWLQIRWRRYLTERYLDGWLANGNHYRMQMLGDAADNPDQRIAEDVKLFIDSGSTNVGLLPIGLGVLNSVVTLISFFVILWGLSEAAQLSLFGWQVPGYLFWAALLYAIAGTVITHLIGRALTALNFNQQRYEADFRFNLVRARENSEQIALLHGEPAERGRLIDRFTVLAANWMRIVTRTKYLSFFTVGYSQVSIIFPYIVVSPAYFAEKIQLGGLMQTASAFSSVQDALSFFISVYRSFAEWRAVVERLAGFERAIEQGRTVAEGPQTITVAPGAAGITLDKVDVALPTGKTIVSADGVSIAPRERVLVMGPSGSGKSTLFRAIAGIWPFGRGKVTVPAQGNVMTLPQRPYLPIGSLAATISYPSEPGRFDAATLTEMLNAVGLPALTGRLDEDAHWSRMLSLGEQQRVGIARAILHAPDFLLLDEATASLDEPSEAALYKLLHERLPASTIVSIGHRATLAAYHDRRLTLARDGDHFAVEKAALSPAS